MTRNKILIADDEDSMRDIEEITLEENFPQFEVESFKDGTSLEDRLKRGVDDVKLIITDNQMPGPNGGGLIAKYAGRYSEVKFILCYGGNDLLGETAVKMGAFAY